MSIERTWALAACCLLTVVSALQSLWFGQTVWAADQADVDSPADEILDPRWVELPHRRTRFVPPRYDSLEEWERRREQLRRQILWSAGLWPLPEKTPLNARIFDRIEHEDYSIEKVYFESIPGLFVTGNLYRPLKTMPRSHAAVLNPHGHAPTGRLHDDEVASIQGRCITFARLGCTAFMWDMIDYNDSAMQLQGHYPDAKSYWNMHNAPWRHGKNRQTLWNINALGVQLWNSIRALDFLESLPEVDPQRLACTGASGGGTQTFLLGAVDERLKVAAPVCMVSSYMQGGCNCENAPGLRIDTHNTEIAALIAPRPMMLVSVTKDWTSHTPAVELPAIRSIYGLYDAPGDLAHVHLDARHGYNRDMRNAVYPWLAAQLGVTVPDNFEEPPYVVEDVDDLLVFRESVPKHAIRDHGTLVDRLIESAKQRLERHRPVNPEQLAKYERVFAEGLRVSIGVSSDSMSDIHFQKQGDFQTHEFHGEHGVLVESRRGVRIPVWVLRPRPATATESAACSLLIDGQGSAAVWQRRELLRGLLADGQAVFVIDPFDLGEARVSDEHAQARRSMQEDIATNQMFFTTFNRTDDAERICDILAAIAYCQRSGAGDHAPKVVNVAGFGLAGPWLAIAAAARDRRPAADVPLRFVIDGNRFDTSRDEEYLNGLFVPGVLRAGGLPYALTLCGPHALLHNLGDQFDTSLLQAARSITPSHGRPSEFKISPTAIEDRELLAYMQGTIEPVSKPLQDRK